MLFAILETFILLSISLLLCMCAFAALTLLVGHQEEQPACKTWVMRCWCGYQSGARCRLFALSSSWYHCIPKPHRFLPHLNPDWFYLSGIGLPRLYWKRGREMGVVVLVVVIAMYVHHLGLYCIVFRRFLISKINVALQLTKLWLKKVTTTS